MCWIAGCVAAALLVGAMGAQQREDGRKLVWSEEFDKPGMPDPAKWDYETGFVRNREAQFYTRARKENARVQGGFLVIEARKESYQNASYTSASLTTRASWTGGRIEVRARIPTGRGSWPAIWMLGTNIKEIGWPACGEIDIMENVGHVPDRIHGTVHVRDQAGKHLSKGGHLDIPAPHADFHVYAIDWDQKRIQFLLDGKVYFEYANDGKNPWPFDKPHYLLINLAIGGSWGGQQGIDDSIFPLRYLVDYVRVYQ